jgi:hypothetical protein
MKYIIIFFGLLFFLSCNSSKIAPPPKEACENIALKNSITTSGFPIDIYDSVIVQTYVKNSKFDTTISEYTVPLRDQLDLPETVTTGFDLKIIIYDSLEFKITEMKTAWDPKYCQDFCGYTCDLVSSRLNGILEKDGRNICIKKPTFVNE